MIDDPSGKSRPFSARMDIVRSYPSLANRSFSADVTIHDISDSGCFGTAVLRLARGMHVRIRLPGAGVRDADVTWAEFPNFACAFREPVSTKQGRAAGAGRAGGTSSEALARAVIGLGGMMFLAALLWNFWA